jgi:hypothetical protein
MILSEEKSDVVVQGEFETNSFSIQSGSKAFSILSEKIYSNPVKAVIRELSTNAADSHLLAGNDQPFDVHLPTNFEKWFSVRDYGTGMSHKDCMNIYTTYFHSTKTHSNDFNGCLGIGSKSPLAISNSFTVVSFFNGEKKTYSAYKDSSNCPQFALLSSEKTDEPNGLLVSVPVNEYKILSFDREATHIYTYFDTVPNINKSGIQQAIDDCRSSYTITGDGFKTSGHYGKIQCRMGNISYPIDVFHKLSPYDIILDFNIGDFEFTPGREALICTDKLRQEVINRLNDVAVSVFKILQKKVDKAESFYEAKIILSDTVMTKPLPGFYWRMRSLYTVPVVSETISFVKNGTTVKRYKSDTISYSKNCRYFTIKDKFTTRIRQEVRKSGVRIVLVHEEDIEFLGLKKSQVEDLSVLPKVERPPSRSKPHQVFRLYVSSRGLSQVSWYKYTVSDSDEKVYVQMDRWGTSYTDDFQSFRLTSTVNQLSSLVPIPQIYGIRKQKTTDLFLSKHGFISIQEYYSRELNKIDLTSFSVYSGAYSIYFSEIAKYVNNHLFQKFLNTNHITDFAYEAIKKITGKNLTITDLDLIEDQIFETYPLLKHITRNYYCEEFKYYIKGKDNELHQRQS